MRKVHGFGGARVLNRSARCAVNVGETLRYLGHSGQAIDDALEKRLERVIAACEASSHPSWCYQAFPCRLVAGGIELAGSTLRLEVAGVAEPLSRACGCVVMACTLGLVNEMESQRIGVAETTDALIFDAASSSLVEACADDCERAVHWFASEQGLHAGQRVSPGYGDLPLSLQRALLRTLDAGKALGISATEGDLLIPMKSVTAFIGLFEREEDACRARRSCAECVAASGCSYLQAGRPCWQRATADGC